MKEKKSKSNSLGQQIDVIFEKDREIHKAEKDLKELKQARFKLETALLKGFDKEDIDGCKGTRGTARIRRAEFFSIKNPRKFYRYVLKHEALDLFQNRVSSRAYKARLEEGEHVPGVKKFERIGVTVTKRGR